MRKEWGEADKNGCVYRGCDGWEEKHSSSPSPPSSSFTPHMILGRGGPNVFFGGVPLPPSSAGPAAPPQVWLQTAACAAGCAVDGINT